MVSAPLSYTLWEAGEPTVITMAFVDFSESATDDTVNTIKQCAYAGVVDALHNYNNAMVEFWYINSRGRISAFV